jgi:hypothetical protein
MNFKELWQLVEEQNNLENREQVIMFKASFKRAMKFAYKKGAETKPKPEVFDWTSFLGGNGK